jgi:hypothetical protein
MIDAELGQNPSFAKLQIEGRTVMKELKDKELSKPSIWPYFWMVLGVIGICIAFYAFTQQLNLLGIALLLNGATFVIYSLTYFIKRLERYRGFIRNMWAIFYFIALIIIYLSK